MQSCEARARPCGRGVYVILARPTGGPALTRGSVIVAVVAWLVLCTIHFPLSLRSTPGLYYDEAIQAVPAVDFLRGHARSPALPNVIAIDLPAGPFPWKTQQYMGALKSQLLLAPFALFGATPEVLRRTTTTWGLAGLLLTMLFAARLLGPLGALAAGTLLALDPTFLFVARHDWGSISLALVCRMGGLLLALVAWQRGRAGLAAAAGLVLGLGLYNKVDAAPTLAAAALALAVCRPDVVRALLLERRRQLLAGGAGALVGALPLLVSIPAILRAGGALSEASTLAEKLAVARMTLDGSYFYRLMETGGHFGHMLEIASPRSGWVFPAAAAAAVIVVLLGLRTPAARRGPGSAGLFLVLTWLGSQLALLAVPGANRVHHAMNVHPFPHLVMAAALVALVARAPSGAGARRVARVTALAALVALALHGGWLTLRTLAIIERSGGRGLWSDATTRLARELDHPQATLVCLDWGFHQSLSFQTSHARVREPIWHFRTSARPWRGAGGPDHHYLVHEGDFDVFGYAPAFLAAVAEVSARDPARVESRVWSDREGGPVFRSVRFLGPHALEYAAGRFRVRLP